MFTYLLSLDTSLLIQARGLIGHEYSHLVQILGESIVVWWALFLLALWIYGKIKNDTTYKIKALQIFFTIIFVFGLYAIINFFLPQWRPSPQTVVGGIIPLIPHPLDNSFPSGHALFSGALIFGIWKYFRKTSLLIVMNIFAILTLSMRVIGGVHYPGDIVAGLVIWVIGWYLFIPIIEWWFMRRYVYAFFVKVASFLRL